MIDMTGIDQLPSGKFRVRLQYRGDVVGGVVPTVALAVQLRDELKRQIIDGDLLPTKGSTALSLGPKFLSARSGNRDSDGDESRWHTHIAKAAWARKPVTAVTRGDGLAWLRALKRTPIAGESNIKHARAAGESRATLSVSTRRHCVNLARRFFVWAMDQGTLGLAGNPFLGLVVEKEDGDEEEGYQDTWYLDADEQRRFLAVWDDKDVMTDETDRLEKLIVQFAMGTGLREGEQWCLHLADVHVDGPEPHIIVRYGSWDSEKGRYRSPKGRKGEKKKRIVPLFGIALDAARAWLASLKLYAEKNPHKLMFPTERGARRQRPPRSWKKAVEAFGKVPRIGERVWWHLLRHTFASSLIAGWWGMRWWLQDVQPVMGHTDVRTTQIYAHHAPSVVANTAARAHAAYLAGGGSCHGAVTPQRPAARKSLEFTGHARSDSNRRPVASKAREITANAQEIARRDDAVTAIRHVLEMVRDGELVGVTFEHLAALEALFDAALAAYAAGADAEEEEARRA